MTGVQTCALPIYGFVMFMGSATCKVTRLSIIPVNDAFWDANTHSEADKFEAHGGVIVTWKDVKIRTRGLRPAPVC